MKSNKKMMSEKKAFPLLVSRLMQVTVPNQIGPQTSPCERNPQLIITHEVPLSPFVIDLSRTPIISAVTLPHPIMQCSPADLLRNLHVSFEDIHGQLEHEEYPRHLSETIIPLINRPAHDVLWNEIETGAGQLFDTLELPESDVGMDEPADELYTLDDVFEHQTEAQHVRSRSHFLFLNSRFSLHPNWKHAVAGFVGMSFLFVLPISAIKQLEYAKETSAQVEMASVAALSDLRLGASAFRESDYGIAAADFARAQDDFLNAKQAIENISLSAETIAKAMPKTYAVLSTAEALIASGKHLATSAELLSEALNAVRASSSEALTTKLDILSDYLVRIGPEIEASEKALANADVRQVPESMLEEFAFMQSSLPSLNNALIGLESFYDGIRLLLGAENTMRYLVLFQNNTEARPTGGFIGSYAEVTVRDGAIVGITIPGGGSYDLQGALTEFVEAPEPLKLLNARWEFQDANWFPDFPESAKKIIWFYDHAGGPTVDGVIAVNATSVAELLSIIGAIDMPEYGRTIDSENFLFETQKIVEVEYDKEENRPKQFLADLAPRLLARIEEQDTMSLLTVLQQVATTFSTREAQVYVRDPELMKLIDALGWSGRVAMTEGDYLMVIDTNLGGGKTDLVIDEAVQLDVVLNDDGTIDNTVTITREHKGLTGALFTGFNNVDYIRVYTPRGSTLLSAEGDFAPPADELFEKASLRLNTDKTLELITGDVLEESMSGTQINEEFGKTVFGNWMQTKPGSSSTISYTYRLPFTMESLRERNSLLGRVKMAVGIPNVERYALFVQKQSGVLNRSVNVRLHLPDDLTAVWASDEAIWSKEGVLFKNVTDSYLGTLFE
ncbi:MAG: DUF4012 domain-containing protein [Patescibacteria group bacterium]